MSDIKFTIVRICFVVSYYSIANYNSKLKNISDYVRMNAFNVSIFYLKRDDKTINRKIVKLVYKVRLLYREITFQ